MASTTGALTSHTHYAPAGTFSSNITVGPQESHTLPDMWLMEYAHEKLSFVVEINGSHGNATHPGYFHGELEGLQGWTGRLFQAGEVTIPFIPLQQSKYEKVQVPIQYLVPVPPQAQGDMAMPLTGKYKGQVLKVVEADESFCTLVVPASGMVIDIPTSQVVRMFDPKTVLG